MTATISLPLQFALACKFSTIDKQQCTRIRYVSARGQLEFITSTRDSELYVRGSMHLDEQQIMSQSETQTQQEERPRASVFSAFEAEDFDFTVESRLLLKAAQQLENLTKFASGIPPVYRIRFPDDDARFLSLSGTVPQAMYLRDRDSEINSFYMIPTLNEVVEFPFAFRPSAEPVFLQINPLVIASLIQSLGLAPRERVRVKLLNPNDVDELKLELSAEEEAGIRVIAETPVASAGRLPWLLQAERLDAFEEEYSFAALLALAKLMACCEPGDSATLLGGRGGELMIRIPISTGERVCGQFVCIACALTNEDAPQDPPNELVSVHTNKSSKTSATQPPKPAEIVDLGLEESMPAYRKPASQSGIALEESQ